MKVLCIIGMTRSGSTILGNLIGELDGSVAAGELHYLWKRGLREGGTCGCGEVLRSCEFWTEVLEQPAGAKRLGDVDAEEVTAWQRRVARNRHLRRLLRADAAGPREPALRRYLETLAATYRAVSEVGGARLVVDTSKRPAHAALLRMVPGVTPYYLHLVRDPRAVAYSWSRRKPDPDLSRKELIRHGPLFSATNWLGVNVTASSIGRREPSRYMLLRYEDFVGAPMETLRSIAAFVDEPCAGAVFVDDKTPVLTRHHTVAGNPSRFASGPTALRPRESWRGGLPPLHAAVVDAICLPLMLRYGYDPGRARRGPAAAPSPEGP